ncbi:MAG: tetratricopeptide repeat protein [Kofleriaceae bacterium]
MRWLVVVLAIAATAPAWAQSKRYPTDPVDKDDEAKRKSKLWDAATNPQRTPYDSLIAEAQQFLEDRTAEGAREAITKLDEAVKLMPDESTGYRMRGDATMTLKDWARCATDYQAAVDHLKRTDVEAKGSADLRRRLGLCQARAGKLADAERTLAEAAASGIGNGEIWMRLGEVRIAMGKLEEAIGALESALDFGDVSPALVRWLLAGAYDRARKPAQALDAGVKALAADRELSTLKSNTVPLLGNGETEYLMGLGFSMYDPPKAEYSLIYFRRFLKLAPDSPWRRRAEDHLRELKASELPEFVEKRGGNALLEPVVARPPVRKLMPQMRQCMAKLPGVVLEVTITKSGPRTPVPTGARRSYLPPDGVTILPATIVDGSTKADIDAAIRCIEPIGDKVKTNLPAIKDKDAYYKAVFSIVAP